ncbi:hypothetical protein BT69DRAFT_1266247 [Atractiella rhizophila]|nr:hypothetical protein BT69DRAFT_1266247 [Atractiella rhizophila]
MAADPPGSANARVAKEPPPSFQEITPTTLYFPTNHDGRIPSDEPSIILIFGWMDAPRRALLSYVSLHRSLFPRSPILLFTTSASFFFLSQAKKRSQLLPLLPFFFDSVDPSRTYLHLFSNGGCAKYALFSNLLRDHKSQGFPVEGRSKFEPVATIFDSCPGSSGTLRSFVHAFSAPFSKSLLLLKIGVKSLLVFVYILLHTLRLLLRLVGRRSQTPVDILRAALNKRGRLMRRLYIYSDKDALVPAGEVERHAKDATDVDEERRVKLWRLEGSEHVAHARKEPGRYREEVKGFWVECCGAEKKESDESDADG